VCERLLTVICFTWQRDLQRQCSQCKWTQ